MRPEDEATTGVTVAANVDLEESDLTPIDPQHVAAAAMGRAGGAAEAGTNATFTLEEQERAQRVWWYLLFAGLLLLVTETVISNRMGTVRV